MVTRALDKNGDIATSGKQFLDIPVEEIAQTIGTRLHLFLNEYFRNINEGTDWKGIVFNKSVVKNTKDALIRGRIRGTRGVKQILSYSSVFSEADRTLSIECSVQTTTGETITVTESRGL